MKQTSSRSWPEKIAAESERTRIPRPHAEFDRVSHGLRIFGQIPTQDNLPILSADERIAANVESIERIPPMNSLKNISALADRLAADNVRAMASIDAMGLDKAGKPVLQSDRSLLETCFDCSLQVTATQFSSPVYAEAQEPRPLAAIMREAEAFHQLSGYQLCDNVSVMANYEAAAAQHAAIEQPQIEAVPETAEIEAVPERSDAVEVAIEPLVEPHRTLQTKRTTDSASASDGLKYHPEVRRVVDQLAKQLQTGKSRVWQFHALTSPAHEEAVTQLWPLALCWANTRLESLLIVDATTHGHSLASAWGWQEGTGLQDVLLKNQPPSAALQTTHWPGLTFLSRGTAKWPGDTRWGADAEEGLRLKSLLIALQRDHAAVWIVTSGQWNPFCHTISEAAHKRELVIPLSSNESAKVWRASVEKLLKQNVLINGWLGLGSSGTKQLSA